MVVFNTSNIYSLLFKYCLLFDIYLYLFVLNMKIFLFNFVSHDIHNNFCCKIHYFHSTDNGETSEKSHGASNCWQHVYKFCCSVLGDFVECWGVKVDPYISQLVFPFKCYQIDIEYCMQNIQTNLSILKETCSTLCKIYMQPLVLEWSVQCYFLALI